MDKIAHYAVIPYLAIKHKGLQPKEINKNVVTPLRKVPIPTEWL